MLIAAGYPFLDIRGTMVIFFAWVAWIWDRDHGPRRRLRRHDIRRLGQGRLGALRDRVAVLGRADLSGRPARRMRERSLEQAKAQQAALDQCVRETGGGSATAIAKAKELLDFGAITQAEFDSIKAKALAH